MLYAMAHEQYFEANPAVASAPKTMSMRLGDREVELITDTGVFSHGHLDPGTDVLLRTIPPVPQLGDVLDLGCGYGPIALYVAMTAPLTRVWAVDINQRAVAATQKNARRLRLENVHATVPHQVPADLRFTAMYCNPPIRIGKPALHELLTTWLDRLVVGGVAYLVVQRHLGADSLAKWLVDRGHHVSRVASKRAYRVLSVDALPEKSAHT